MFDWWAQAQPSQVSENYRRADGTPRTEGAEEMEEAVRRVEIRLGALMKQRIVDTYILHVHKVHLIDHSTAVAPLRSRFARSSSSINRLPHHHYQQPSLPTTTIIIVINHQPSSTITITTSNSTNYLKVHVGSQVSFSTRQPSSQEKKTANAMMKDHLQQQCVKCV